MYRKYYLLFGAIALITTQMYSFTSKDFLNVSGLAIGTYACTKHVYIEYATTKKETAVSGKQSGLQFIKSLKENRKLQLWTAGALFSNALIIYNLMAEDKRSRTYITSRSSSLPYFIND